MIKLWSAAPLVILALDQYAVAVFAETMLGITKPVTNNNAINFFIPIPSLLQNFSSIYLDCDLTKKFRKSEKLHKILRVAYPNR